MEKVGKILRKIYDDMLAAYRSGKDKDVGVRDALNVYLQNEPALSDIRSLLSDIEDLHQVIVESWKVKKPATIRSGCLVSKLVACGKHCGTCPHGPYLYKVQKIDGKQTWTYLGKTSASKSYQPNIYPARPRVGKRKAFDNGEV